MTFIRVKTPGTLNAGIIRPKLYADSIMAAGSLLLLDPTHTADAWGSAVPAAGDRLPNLAANNAIKVIGGTPEVRAQWLAGSGNTAANSKFERTTKGGLHGIITKTAAASTGAKLTIPSAISAYMEANPNHIYYASLWHDITRISGAALSNSPFVSMVVDANAATNTSNYFYAFRTALTRPNVAPAYQGMRPADGSTLDVAGKTLRNIAFSRMNAASTKDGNAAQWGTAGIIPNTGVPSNGYPSFVFYRYYLEDLTVSGRSYAEVDGLDNAKYTAEVLTAGGRYYADTYTAASTIA
jgi:hypothetical protein